LLYEHATEMTEHISKSMGDAAKEAAIGSNLALLTWNRYIPGGSDQKRQPCILLRGMAKRAAPKLIPKEYPQGSGEPDNPGGL
jgi:hypothetical protein